MTRSALPHQHHGKSDAESAMEPDGYHCPYCNGQSVDGSWTVAQLAATFRRRFIAGAGYGPISDRSFPVETGVRWPV